MPRTVLVLLLALVISGSARGQATQPSLAERLGYPRDAKLLIVHADDLGMSHSVNAASIKGLESKQVTSASIMVPCPWFPEIAEYARAHPDADFGLHLTLTSEWSTCRWRPLTQDGRVSSLLDPAGYLYPTTADAVAHLDPKQVEIELRAQIDRAIASGVRPTHLDSHMFALYADKRLFEVALRVARDYKLPLKVSRDFFPQFPFMTEVLEPTDVVVDRVVTIDPSVTPERWAEFYADALRGLQPGVTELIIHLAYDDEEMRAVTIGHPEWGSAWRQREFDFFTSERFRRLLDENNIKLVTWREIGKLLSTVPAPAARGGAEGGEKTVKVKDGWGNEATVQGFNEERQPDGKWFVHDPERPQPRAVEPGPSPTLGAKPPEGAVVLFDGKDASGWTGGPWRVADGYMEVNGTGNVTSKAEFGDARLHVEFATPAVARGEGQDRGNSGVFLMGRYEIQVLDSWKSATYPDGQCGAVYGQSPPSVNASRPPGEWQTYDITFTAPRFDDEGRVRSPARVTVLLNGVTVQDGFELFGETGWRHRATYHAHGPTGPLALQDHGHPVRYRNIWFVPLKEGAAR